jgi:hypothetical protein
MYEKKNLDLQFSISIHKVVANSCHVKNSNTRFSIFAFSKCCETLTSIYSPFVGISYLAYFLC